MVTGVVIAGRLASYCGKCWHMKFRTETLTRRRWSGASVATAFICPCRRLGRMDSSCLWDSAGMPHTHACTVTRTHALEQSKLAACHVNVISAISRCYYPPLATSCRLHSSLLSCLVHIELNTVNECDSRNQKPLLDFAKLKIWLWTEALGYAVSTWSNGYAVVDINKVH